MPVCYNIKFSWTMQNWTTHIYHKWILVFVQFIPTNSSDSFLSVAGNEKVSSCHGNLKFSISGTVWQPNFYSKYFLILTGIPLVMEMSWVSLLVWYVFGLPCSNKDVVAYTTLLPAWLQLCFWMNIHSGPGILILLPQWFWVKIMGKLISQSEYWQVQTL